MLSYLIRRLLLMVLTLFGVSVAIFLLLRAIIPPLARTGDIGICKIVYEGSISAGVRRIEAITGEEALRRFQSAQAQLAGVASLVKSSESDLLDQLDKLVALNSGKAVNGTALLNLIRGVDGVQPGVAVGGLAKRLVGCGVGLWVVVGCRPDLSAAQGHRGHGGR